MGVHEADFDTSYINFCSVAQQKYGIVIVMMRGYIVYLLLINSLDYSYYILPPSELLEQTVASIMEHVSTLCAGWAGNKMAATLKIHRWHVWKSVPDYSFTSHGSHS